MNNSNELFSVRNDIVLMEASSWITKILPRVDLETRYEEGELAVSCHQELAPYNADSINGCLALGSRGLSCDLLLHELDKKRTNFDKDHFYMLLRELTLDRTAEFGLAYYLDWIIKQLRQPGISRNTRQLFSSVARSILNPEPAVHSSEHPNNMFGASYSPLFTAYSGFFLLILSSDWRANMRTMITEVGVTAHGLDLAGMLTGAYLGLTGISD